MGADSCAENTRNLGMSRLSSHDQKVWVSIKKGDLLGVRSPWLLVSSKDPILVMQELNCFCHSSH